MLTNNFLLLVGVLLIVTSANPAFKDCNFTDYRFQNEYSLGRQDELNKTFDAINNKFTVPDIVYPVNSYTNYSFTQIKTSVAYLDSKQKAQIVGNDQIVISGGFLEAVMEMNWTRKDLLEKGGSLQALCRSQQIFFAKNLSIDRGFLVYQITDYRNISFQSTECKLLRYEPANISQLDMSYIRQLLNQRDDKKETAKSSLATQINKKYFYQLNNSLYNQKHQLDNQFFYVWSDEKKQQKLSIEYQVLPTGVDLQKKGLSFTFVTEIKDYQKWQCGATIPHQNLDIQKYGGLQEFLSLSVFKNTLKYGIDSGVLDVTLNKADWQSKMFQFYAGDLYEVMPYVSKYYMAREQIVGKCKGSSQNVSITAEQNINEIVARTGHVCQLFIQQTTKILEIHIDLYSQIEARFQEQGKVNFYVKGFTHNLSYLEEGNFKIADYQLANAMVANGLNLLLQSKTFGSGWPIFKMDLPQMKVMSAGYVVFYDTSHVGGSAVLDQ